MDISKLREGIDTVDQQILDLFVQRMELSEQVAEYKKANSLPIVNRQREREVLAGASEKAGQYGDYAYQLFSRLIDLSKARQSELFAGETAVRSLIDSALLPAEKLFPRSGMVACQGVEGSNSQQACEKLMARANIMYFKTFEAVFSAVDSGLCEYGVLPIENNINGSVRAVYELLQRYSCSIVRQTRLNIRHELMAKPGAKLSDIKEIYSHEQAIGQCGAFLSSLGADVKIIPCANTALAAKIVSESDDLTKASISAPACVELYGLNVLRDDVQDSENNYTKFICITKKPAIYAGSSHTSLIISCANKPGALSDILSMLSARGINMVKLESCPVTGRNFEFIFYLELDANVREPGVVAMLEELERTSESFTFLGCYAEV
ncbi:MAG: ACT domain-containing protein [Ruminococcaceae bacterium]|nr:ACT domain-containing protein [Oscillospiraceae bacterium]